MLQQLVNGLFRGSMYAVFALGYTLVFGVLDILNLAHAAVFMVASFVALTLVEHLQASGVSDAIYVALPLAMIFSAGLGLVLERVAFRPLRARADSNIAGLISSLAVATILGAIAQEIWGPNATSFPDGTLAWAEPKLGEPPPLVAPMQLVVIAVAGVLVVALTWLVQRTRLGRELRAVAESPRAAQVVGVNVDRAIAASFAISSALGGAAGVLYGLAYKSSIQTTMGQNVELKGLAVIILGGMGSMPGAVIAGLALGLVETFVVAHLGGSSRDVVAFAGLFLVLVLRPHGLFGAASAREA